MSVKSRLLLIEDDAVIASGLVYALENEGFFVTHIRDVTSFQFETKPEGYDLAIIDIGLPDGTGFELADALKAAGVSMLYLTAVDEEGYVVRAFEGGADDYVTKPFRLGELMARVKAALRRRSGRSETLTLGEVSINVGEGKAYVREKISDALSDAPPETPSGKLPEASEWVPLDLTALEYRLLLTFANHKGQLLTRGQILNLLWDSAGVFVEDNTLTVYIKRLREKLNGSANIETVRGVGYRANVH
ncbi:MAG: response regulator transcription factor [Defluviitaleaceae bacterium]|nr:response regulator transcription factor [Defluviitaleaceae bacterium]